MPASLDTADRAAFVAAFGGLFEHSPWVADETFGRRPFRDAKHFHAELCATLRRASPDRQLALINAHPDLAGRMARLGQLTAASTGEQAAAGLDRISEGERALFTEMNAAYRARFGFPFVICARLNAKDAILNALRERIKNTPEVEKAGALAEIEKIAWLRLTDALA